MSDVARITTLVDNYVQGRALLAEHGLAFWLEMRGQRVLFDTGQGLALPQNAAHLGVALERVDKIVLSHGHYDHTGGLAHLLDISPQAKVHAHPAALEPKFARNDDGASRDVGMPSACRKRLDDHKDALIPIQGPTEICEGLFVTGEVPRRTEYEDVGGPFFVDQEGRRPDPLLDDGAIFFDSRQGTVVMLGCAHAGVINTLHRIRELTGGKPIHAVMGGMHLITADRDRVDRTIKSLRQLEIESVIPGHCTGLAAAAELWSAFQGRCRLCVVGMKLEFEIS